MIRVYIAGPMTGYEDWNRPAFAAAAAHLRARGLDVVNPAELDAGMSDAELAETPHHEFLRRDIAHLLSCQAIYFLPGSRWSKGAMLERTVAEGTGIFELVEPDVEKWRTFEGTPLDERCCTPACDEMHTFDAGCELEVSPVTREFAGLDNDDACHEFTCPAHGEANRREAEAEALDLLAATGPFAGLDIETVIDNSIPEGVIRLETPAGDIDFRLAEDLSGLTVVGMALAPAGAEDLPAVDCEAVEGDGAGNEWCAHGVQVAHAPEPDDDEGVMYDLGPVAQGFARFIYGVLGGGR